MRDERDRDFVCDKYKIWLYEKIADKDAVVMLELKRLMQIAIDEKNLILKCYCHPKRCHGDIIKEFLDKNIETYIKEN